MEFPFADAISRIPDPLDWTEENRTLFVRACGEMAAFHEARSPEIRFLYGKYRFDPASVREERDLERIPTLGVPAMKHYLLLSLPAEACVLKLTSSGTGGQKTQIWFDEPSLDRVQAMLESLWRQEGLISEDPTNYLNFVYDPAEAKDLGVAFTDKNQHRFAPVARSHYAIRKNGSGEWAFDRQGAIAVLRRYAEEGKPVRLFGIPSFFHELLAELERADLTIPLPPPSLVITGGGWKAAEDKKISREAFRELLHRRLRIPLDRIRDAYGMAEHCAPYMECAAHRFHVPAYNHIIIRDPATMAPLPPGRVGLLELITPWNAMVPNLALLSTDVGSIDPDPCGCGHRSPTFTLVGRGGIAKHKGCAIAAAEIVRRG